MCCVYQPPPSPSPLPAPYINLAGKKVITLSAQLEDKMLMSVIKSSLKFPSGGSSPARVLMFLLDHDPAADETSSRLATFDDWGKEEYSKLQQERCDVIMMSFLFVIV